MQAKNQQVQTQHLSYFGLVKHILSKENREKTKSFTLKLKAAIQWQ